jgi:hypothetical protein
MCQYPHLHTTFPYELFITEKCFAMKRNIMSSFWSRRCVLKVAEQKGPHQSFQKTLFFDVAGTCVHEDSSYSSLVCHTVDMQMVPVHHYVHPGYECWDLICWQNPVNTLDTWHWDELWQSMHKSQVSLWHTESDRMNEWMFIDHSMGRSPTGCRARQNTQLKNKTIKTVSGHTTILLLNALIQTHNN